MFVPLCAGSLRRWIHDGTLGSRSIHSHPQGDTHKRRDTWNACVFIAYTALALHAVIVLLGAFVHYVLHTVSPSPAYTLYTLGPPRLGLLLLSASASSAIAQNDLWIRIFGHRNTRKSAELCLLYPTYGAYLGACFGVIPIDLDWDRPWQAYP
ncbi:GPI biosynthesis protein family Pig-F-domain-containing protein [Lactarius quietus]|nr:GPI biosynthesis protein family Pig-F-domain-containing protein [Lactarius quietus]